MASVNRQVSINAVTGKVKFCPRKTRHVPHKRHHNRVAACLRSSLGARMRCPEPRGPLANFKGSLKDTPDGKKASQFVRSNGSQAHGSEASARRTIWIPTELARSDLGSEICRQRLRRERKDTFLRTVRRRSELPNNCIRHVQLSICLP